MTEITQSDYQMLPDFIKMTGQTTILRSIEGASDIQGRIANALEKDLTALPDAAR